MGANIAFAHVLRDDADDLMTVHLDKCESLESTIYRMNIEIYEELVALSDRYEQSILANKNVTREPENEPASSSESDKENDTEDNILTYTDRRQRRGRGGRYFDILAALKQ